MIAMTTLTLGRCVLIISLCSRVGAELDNITRTWAHSTNIHTMKRKITKRTKIRTAVKL